MHKLKRLINVQIIQPLSVITSFKKRFKHYDELEAQIQLQESSAGGHDSLLPILSDIIDYQFTTLAERALKSIVFPQGDFGLFYKAAIYRTSAILQKMILTLEIDKKNYSIFLESLKHFGCALVEKPVLVVGDIQLELGDILYILEQTKEVASYADVLDVLVEIHREAFRASKFDYLVKIKQCTLNQHNKEDNTFDDLVFLQDLKENNRQCDKSAYIYYMKNRYKISFELFSEALRIISRRNNQDERGAKDYLVKFILASNLCTPYAFEGKDNLTLSEVLQECILNAAWEGNLKKIDLLFDLGAPLNALTQISYNWSGRLETCKNAMVSIDCASLMQMAVLTGNLLLVEKIIFKGGDINEKGSKGLSPLHLACAGWKIAPDRLYKPYQYKLNVIQDLESKRTYIQPNLTLLFSQTEQASSLSLTIHLIRRLLDMGADVNSVDDQGMTPLHMVEASQMSLEEKFQLTGLLLSYHANPNMQDINNRLPFEYIQQDDAVTQEFKFKFIQLFQNYSNIHANLKP